MSNQTLTAGVKVKRARHLSIWIIVLVISSGLMLAGCATEQAQTNPDTPGLPITFNDEGDIRVSDPGITPADLSTKGPDGFEPDNALIDARPFRIDSQPQDHTLHADDDEDWYLISPSSNEVYLRIGATGPISIDSWARKGRHNSLAEYRAPGPEATLIQNIKELTGGGRYIQIRNLSDSPIVYRLSVLSELPLFDLGAPTPQIAVSKYIHAVAEGDRKTLFKMTRERITRDQATSLRKKLFGQTEPIAIVDLDVYDSEGSEFKLVQRKVFGSMINQQVYAFVVACESQDSLYPVVSARRHRTLSKEAKAALLWQMSAERCTGCHTGRGGTNTGTCVRDEELDISVIW